MPYRNTTPAHQINEISFRVSHLFFIQKKGGFESPLRKFALKPQLRELSPVLQ